MRRRSTILAVARKLIAEKGYAGVTMRELASESSVAYKSLYDLYGSKDNLLGKAIEERLRTVYGAMQQRVSGKGLDRLLQIVEQASRGTLEIPNLSRALEPILATDPGRFSIREIYSDIYRPALQDIKDQGELEPWADIDFLLRQLMFDNNNVRLHWAREIIADEELIPAQKYVVCSTLLPLVTGETLEHARSLHRALHNSLKEALFRLPRSRQDTPGKG